MTESSSYPRPITESLLSAHPKDARVVRNGQELTLEQLQLFEAAMCKAPPEARSDAADARFMARVLFDGGSLREDFVHLLELEQTD